MTTTRTAGDQPTATVIDLAEERRRRGALRPPKPRTTSGQMRRLRERLAHALREFQASRLAMEDGYDPWARCPFWRVPAPDLAQPDLAGAVVVLVDAVESYLVWQARAESGWRCEEFSTQPLEARVVAAPAGWLTLCATAPDGKVSEREVEVCSGEVVFVRVQPRGGAWRWDEVRWAMAAPNVGAVRV